MRAWIKFSKEESLCFLSHLDLMRTWQRAIRRAGLPVAYSSGFNPHQRLSFASALPVGATSETEYLDVIFNKEINLKDFKGLQDTLPHGLCMKDVKETPPGVPALMSLVRAAGWSVILKRGVYEKVTAAVAALLGSVSLEYQREGKKGKKTLDLRPLILDLRVSECENGCKLCMLLITGDTGGAKPQEVLNILGIDLHAQKLNRTGLLIRIGDNLQDPMDVLLSQNEVLLNAKKDYYKL